jgi:hypothetical protein
LEVVNVTTSVDASQVSAFRGPAGIESDRNEFQRVQMLLNKITFPKIVPEWDPVAKVDSAKVDSVVTS